MAYDPFIRGHFSVGVRTIEARDNVRGLPYLCELWYPASESHFGQDYAEGKPDVYTLPGGTERRTQVAIRNAGGASGLYPLVVYSHGSARWQRRSATFLCTHLASRGYVVAAIDHYEMLVSNVTREVAAQNRALDITFLLDFLLGPSAPTDIGIEPSRMSAVGYSLGGWTVLRAMEDEARIRSLAVLAPAGTRSRRGMFSGKLTFRWKREVHTLLLSAANDVMFPQARMGETFKQIPSPKRGFVLNHADHMHFVDGVAEEHEIARTTAWPEELEWISAEMRPANQLVSEEISHAFTSGLVTAHLDSELLWLNEARKWYATDLRPELAMRKMDALESGRVSH